MAQHLRLLAIHAHPDDESSKGAATMAKYVAEGVRVMVATCTGGERGAVLNPQLNYPEVLADIPSLRRTEMARACQILGVEHTWLGFLDSGLPEGHPPPPLPSGCFGLQDVVTAARPLIKLIRDFRPQVLLTYDENGGYPHPDHIMCHRISVLAFDRAGDAQWCPDLGEPWQPSKLYYNPGWTSARMRALHAVMVSAGLKSPYREWQEQWLDQRDRTITSRIQCAAFFEIRDQALRAHATQIDPDGFWFRVPIELQRTVWPVEEFELARSLVAFQPSESDLFAGIRSEETEVVSAQHAVSMLHRAT